LITLYAAMLVTLGFLIAALMVVVLLPAYRRRIERFATEALKRLLPLTEDEIRADKDRLRANFAMEVHRLETKVEEAGLSAARQSVEVNRRDAKIQELTEAIAARKMSGEEHENARRVLEQAILDRLPKVEQRLAETRKLLATRDREIRSLLATSAKQATALEEAAQLNVQREKELSKLRVTLDTRASRDRRPRADERVDGNVALRSEVEALRAQNRDQAALIERLRGANGIAKAASAEDGDRDAEIKRLTLALARAESHLAAIKAGADGGDAERMALEDRVADLQATSDARFTELAKLRAALKTYEENAGETPGIAQKADFGAVQVEVDQQRRTIAALRAEIAASQERLSRQALHFHDELRRMGSQPAGDAVLDAEQLARKPLVERIMAPRPVRSADHEAVNGGDAVESSREGRPESHLRALNGVGSGKEANTGTDEVAASIEPLPPPLPAAEPGKEPGGIKPALRRPRLLERISGLDKR
jgi:hypothetical protein